MIFQEPKVEFVQITPSNVMTASATANYETCNGDNAYSNSCTEYGIYWADNKPPVSGCDVHDVDADDDCIS